MRQSSKRDFRIVSDGPKRFRVEWRYRRPGLLQRKGWQWLQMGGIYSGYMVWQASSCEDAEAAIESLLREDDPPPWTEVTCGSIP